MHANRRRAVWHVLARERAKTLTFKSNAKYRRRTARQAARAFLAVTARPESVRTNGARAPCSGPQAVGQREAFSAHPISSP